MLVPNHELELVNQIGGSGRGPGEVNRPSFLSISNQRLYVLDGGNNRYNTYELDGTYRGQIQLTDAPGSATIDGGFTVSADGHIWLSTREEDHPLLRFDGEGTFFASYPIPSSPHPIYHHTSHLLTTDQQDLLSIRMMDASLERFNQEGELMDQMDLSVYPEIRRTHKALDITLASEPDLNNVFAPVLVNAAYCQGKLFILTALLDENSSLSSPQGNINHVLVCKVYPSFRLTDYLILDMPHEIEAEHIIEGFSAYEREGTIHFLVTSFNSNLIYAYQYTP